MLKSKKVIALFAVIFFIVGIFLFFNLNKHKEINTKKVNTYINKTKEKIKKLENKTINEIKTYQKKGIDYHFRFYLDQKEPFKRLDKYTIQVNFLLVSDQSVDPCKDYVILAYNEDNKKVLIKSCNSTKITNFTNKVSLNVYGIIKKKIKFFFDKKNESLPNLQPITVWVIE